MTEPLGDESVAPSTGPRAASPADSSTNGHQIEPSTHSPQKQPEGLKAATVASDSSLPNVNGSTTEAQDYLNGGLPHDDPSPLATDGSNSEFRLKLAEQDAFPNSVTTDNGDTAEAVPAGRRSVQFARTGEPSYGHARHASSEDGDTPGKSRGASFMSKLKALAGTGPLQTAKSPGERPHPVSASPTTARTRIPRTLNEENASDQDADAEETADEAALPDAAQPKKKKNKRAMRRFKRSEAAESTPNTPLTRRHTGQDSPTANFGPLATKRRASMPDPNDHHHGLSEGEGRERLRERGWRGGSSWVAGGSHEAEDAESSAVASRRVGHRRRISVFGGGGVSDGDATALKRPIFSGERASTFGVQKWKQVKNTLKLLRQKKDERFDFAKSAELMAELRAGAPAVLMLASMIQRDEHGNKRIPVLLEQVKLRITDSSPLPDDDSERHWIFTIDLEYGSGPSRMKWTIIRTLRDIYNLHLRYKFALKNERYLHLSEVSARPKQPKFPWAAFPYLRGARKKAGDDDEEDAASVRGDEIAEGTAEGTASDVDARPPMPRKKSRNLLGIRRKSTGFTDQGDQSAAENLANAAMELMAARRRYVERQRRVLEKYLQEMVRWLMFRAGSNRLCRFLELSALGVRLAAEGSYHGKECYLHIRSSKGLDFRRVLTPKKVIDRHSRKWFLVRQSYIVCVESPENMNVYDVYLVDPKFRIVSKRSALKQIAAKGKKGTKNGEREIDLTAEEPPEKHHFLTLHTAERKVTLFARYQSVMRQFEESIAEMLKQTPWHQKNRFDSFAPVRTGVFAQWLVDGRDYMWNVSRAINMARDVIYIHDWWLSPELYMRRPAAISQKWRLDRLLQRKAREGVKIFVIVYRNVEAAIPIDSEYTKYSLLNLHPNIFVQRSPNQFKKNQFFFAHHEKICIVDHDVAFVGGIDLCFGRWDCPQHPLNDDKATGFEPDDQPKDAEHCQLFPGKDYSNPRVQDFFRLNEPYEEMYDRNRVPRMPWHDISMQLVGQPARDLTRHFVQRWNYIRRGRKPTRPLPFLLPPPDAKMADLEALGLTGTCEVQILRSAAAWSLGIEDVEQSIHNAYIKMIEDSEHFVYIENQFFITSTEVFGTKITNRIGDALVDRAIRAHENGDDWKCCILIPLMPGFQNTVDEQEGTSVRLIVQCQYRSICRGENSVFGRLRAVGIEPEDYIQFYSLRQWGRIGNDVLVTEQLYIHAKTIIVDDRVALIGSANINERSLIGNRDSECAAIIRDTDMIWSTMGGKPYRVGRFAHTLRLRLMREHLGLDVDEILEQERQAELDRQAQYETEMGRIYNSDDAESPIVAESSQSRSKKKASRGPELQQISSFNHNVDLEEPEDVSEDVVVSSRSSNGEEPTEEERVTSPEHRLEVAGLGQDHWKEAERLDLDKGRDSVIVNGREVLVHNIIAEGKGTLDNPKQPHKQLPSTQAVIEDQGSVSGNLMPPVPSIERRTTEQLGLPRASQLPTLPLVDDTDIGGPPIQLDERPASASYHPLAADIRLVHIEKDCMRDPLNPTFADDIWNRVAENNTKLFRRVFRCMPDSEVLTWADYREYNAYSEKFRESMDGRRSGEGQHKPDTPQKPGSSAAGTGADPATAAQTVMEEKIIDKLHGLGSRNNNQESNKDNSQDNQDNNQDNNPTIITPNNGADAFNEKDIREASHTDPKQSDQGVDVEKSPMQVPIDDPSRALPAGTTPFPAFDGTTTSMLLEPHRGISRERRTTFTTPSERSASGRESSFGNVGSVRRRRRATTKGSRRGLPPEDILTRAEAEELLGKVQGSLVMFAYDWLLTEELNGNWGFQVDGVAPLQIYN